MKKICLLSLLAILLLTGFAVAAELPEELSDALPRETARLLEDTDTSDGSALGDGLRGIVEKTASKAGEVIRERLKGAVCVLLVVLLCGVIDGFQQGFGGGELRLLPMVGALSITLLTAGSLDTLIGLGAETIEQLSVFSKTLMPVLAAATAASGAVSTATVQQVATVFFVDVLITRIDQLLLPMVYLYIGALTASAMLPDNRLAGIADMLKKVLTWLLSLVLMLFTLYLSVAHVISGTADSAKIKLTKAAISGAVPVVGGIISEASETVRAGAGLLKSSIGLFGTLAILAICAYPFLQLAVQYLLYKLAALLCGTVGSGSLEKLIDGLGGAFGMVLGMTGACALLILISVLACVAAVVP